MAKKKTKKKTTRKIRDKAGPKPQQKHKVTEPKKTKYNHFSNAMSGFIDLQLVGFIEMGDKVAWDKIVQYIVNAWNKQHPDKPEMKKSYVTGHIRHLVTEHGFDQRVANKILQGGKHLVKKS